MKRKDKKTQMFGPLRQKNLESALTHLILSQFPRIGGERIGQLCSQMILEFLDEHLKPRERVRHGQLVWLGVSVDDPPSRTKRLSQTDLIPVVLDLAHPDDLEAILDRVSAFTRLQNRCVRLCQQAHQQGALLSNCDLSLMLHAADSKIAEVLVDYERSTTTVVPRRATLHDMGTGTTHKRIICLKHYAEGKTSDQVAKETYHSMDAVDHYLSWFNRVRFCRQQGMTVEDTAFTLKCGTNLVDQYRAIDDELNQGVSSTPRAEG